MRYGKPLTARQAKVLAYIVGHIRTNPRPAHPPRDRPGRRHCQRERGGDPSDCHDPQGVATAIGVKARPDEQAGPHPGLRRSHLLDLRATRRPRGRAESPMSKIDTETTGGSGPTSGSTTRLASSTTSWTRSWSGCGGPRVRPRRTAADDGPVVTPRDAPEEQ